MDNNYYNNLDRFDGEDKNKGSIVKQHPMFFGMIIGGALAYLLMPYLGIGKGEYTPPEIITDTVYIERTSESKSETPTVAATDTVYIEPQAKLSIPGMNTIYVGTGAILKINPGGFNVNDLVVTASDGYLDKLPGQDKKGRFVGYSLVTLTTGEIVVTAKTKSGVKLGYWILNVEDAPTPMPAIGKDPKTMRGGQIAKSTLLNIPGVRAEHENPMLKDCYTVTSFKVTGTIKGFETTEESDSDKFTPKQRQLITNLATGSIVSIHDITAKTNQGASMTLPSVVYKLR